MNSDGYHKQQHSSPTCTRHALLLDPHNWFAFRFRLILDTSMSNSAVTLHTGRMSSIKGKLHSNTIIPHLADFFYKNKAQDGNSQRKWKRNAKIAKTSGMTLVCLSWHYWCRVSGNQSCAPGPWLSNSDQIEFRLSDVHTHTHTHQKQQQQQHLL